MNTIDFIKLSIQSSKNWILGLANDIKDEPLVAPTPHGGNHPLWCLGHLAYSEANLVTTLCKGETNPLAEWESIFQMGAKPSTAPNDYPSIDEVSIKLDEVNATTMAFLDSIDEADLDRASHAEGHWQEWFPTVGHCLSAIPIHFAFHGGQIADARRAAGRETMMG